MVFKVGDIIGLSNNFPITPVQKYDLSSQRNQTIPINGLEISIIDYDSTTGVYQLMILFGQYEVSGTQRWCGDLRLPDLDGDTLHVHQGDSILLDLSGTPDRRNPHPLTGTFANPTVLTLDSGAHVHLADSARLLVENHSTLIMKSGSLLELEHAAVLRVRNTGRLIMEPGSEIRVKGEGEVHIQPGGYFRYEKDALLTLQDDTSCLMIEGEWVIDTSATFGFQGDGFVFLRLPNLSTYQDSNVFLRPGAGIHLTGSGSTDRVLIVDTHTTLNVTPGSRLFAIEDGKAILRKEAALILDEVDSVQFDQATITGLADTALYDRVWLVDAGVVSVDHSSFRYGTAGLDLYESFGYQGPGVAINSSHFTECGNGLTSMETSISIDHGSFSENLGDGWRNYQGIDANEARNASFSDNGYKGINYHGKSLTLSDVSLMSNGTEGAMIRYGTLSGSCVEARYNTGPGILVSNAGALHLSYSNLRDNHPNIRCSFAHVLNLDKGYNRVSPSASTYLIDGDLSGTKGPISARHNQWASSLLVSPTFGTEYLLYRSNSSVSISLIDNSPSVAYCQGSGGGGGGTQSQMTMGGGSFSTQSQSLFPPGPAWTAYQQARQQMREVNPNGNDRLAAAAMRSFLSQAHAGQWGTLDSAWLQTAYEQMMSAYFAAYPHQDFAGLAMPDSVSLDLLDYVATQFAQSSQLIDSLSYGLDVVRIHDALGDMDSALHRLQGLIAVVPTAHQPMLDTWACILQAEIDLAAGLLDGPGFDQRRQACEGSSLALRRRAPDQPAIEAVPPPSLTLKPNPAQATVQLMWHQAAPGSVAFQIFDATGQLMHTHRPAGRRPADNHTVVLSLDGWQAGVYLIRSVGLDPPQQAKLWVR